VARTARPHRKRSFWRRVIDFMSGLLVFETLGCKVAIAGPSSPGPAFGLKGRVGGVQASGSVRAPGLAFPKFGIP
jgi:hypothetical protein